MMKIHSEFNDFHQLYINNSPHNEQNSVYGLDHFDKLTVNGKLKDEFN